MKKLIGVIIAVVIIAVVGVVAVNVLNKYTLEIQVDPSQKMTVAYGEEFDTSKVTAIYKGTLLNRKGTEVPVSMAGSLTTKVIGDYDVTWVADYKGLHTEVGQTIEVADLNAPVITLVSDPEHYTSPGAAYKEEGYTAVDDYDGDVTDQVESSEENGIVTYTVTDAAGNTAVVTREIIYKDVVEPIITLSGDSTISIVKDSTFTDPGYIATDDVDGEITDNVEVSSTVDTSTAGTYEVTYTVEDSSGNVATVVRTVNVIEKQSTVTKETDKTIYLTFDDGPGQYTQKLLDILAKYNVKATFFVTNQFPAYQYLIKSEYEAGHTVAIHTYTHDYATCYASVSAFYSDIEKMNDIIELQTGHRSNILRFPGGASNAVSAQYCTGIMTTLTTSSTWGVLAKGYLYDDWNVSSSDASGITDSDTVANNVITGIQNNSSKVSVVLQHDIKEFSVNAVEQIIQWGLANGYTFLPVTTSSTFVHHHVNN